MSSALLSLRGVTAYYGSVKALKGIDLEINKGEIVTLCVDSRTVTGYDPISGKRLYDTRLCECAYSSDCLDDSDGTVHVCGVTARKRNSRFLRLRDGGP